MTNTRFHTTLIAWFIILLCWLATPLHAGLILDEFTDSVETVAPELIDERIETNNVGPFHALRKVAITSGRADPNGVLTVLATEPGILVGDITDLNPRNITGSKRAGTEVQYEFDEPIDLSQAGANDAIFVDFNSFQSAFAPRFTRVFVRASNGLYVSFQFEVPQQDEPFTLAFPFDSFTFRDFTPGEPDFTRVFELDWDLSFRTTQQADDIELNFRMEVERIRVGKIPEPSSWVIMLLAVVPAARLA